MKWILAGLILIGLAAVARAQIDPQSIIDSASGQSARLQALGELFQHPDPAVRYEAFRQLSASQNPLERNLAFQSGLASTDVDMRSLAIITRLQEMNPLVIQVGRGDAPTDELDRWVLQGNETAVLSLPQHAFDALRGTFVVGARPDTPPSQVVGDEVRLSITWQMNRAVCTGTLRLTEARALQGPLDCTLGHGRFPARIDLFH